MNDRPLANLKGKLFLSLLLGLVAVAGLSLYADLPKLAGSLRSFDWVLLVPALLFTFGNYVLRFVKWHLYLAQIGVRGLPAGESALIFFGGLAMVVTPGRVGEWLKSFLLRELTGTPFSTSAPIVVAERLTDAVSMLVLASVGLVTYGYGWQVLLAVLLVAAAVVYVTQHRALAERLFRPAKGLPLVAGRLASLRSFYESSHLLFKPRNLVWAVGLGVVSWFGECIALFLVLVGLGLPAEPTLLLKATFILAVASIVGSASMLPGGLVAAEGSLAGLLLLLGVVGDPATAAAATLIARLCTLWFGVLVGLVALVLFTPRLARQGVRLL